MRELEAAGQLVAVTRGEERERCAKIVLLCSSDWDTSLMAEFIRYADLIDVDGYYRLFIGDSTVANNEHILHIIQHLPDYWIREEARSGWVAEVRDAPRLRIE